MEMTWLGDDSGGGSSPRIFGVDDDTGDFVIQGYRVTDARLLEIARERGLPDHETLVRIPKELVKHFPKDWLIQMAALKAS